MILDLSKVKIYIRPGFTDLRKVVNGLTGIIEGEMECKVFSGNVFVFCNRDRKFLKAVYWDRTGFWSANKTINFKKKLNYFSPNYS